MNIVIEALEKELTLNEKEQQRHKETIAYHQGLYKAFRQIQKMIDDKEDIEKQVKDELASSEMDWKTLMDTEHRLAINKIDLTTAIDRERVILQQKNIGLPTIPKV